MGNGNELDYDDDSNADLEIAERQYFREHPDEAPELDFGHDFDPAEEFAGPDQGDLDWAAAHPARTDLSCVEGEVSPFEASLLTTEEFEDRAPDTWGRFSDDDLPGPEDFARDVTGALDGHDDLDIN